MDNIVYVTDDNVMYRCVCKEIEQHTINGRIYYKIYLYDTIDLPRNKLFRVELPFAKIIIMGYLSSDGRRIIQY